MRNIFATSNAIFPKEDLGAGLSTLVFLILLLGVITSRKVLDARQAGPLFLVALEQCPGKVFIHNLVGKCWEMVRDRVNQEITRHHKLGKPNLLQPPGSLGCFEMFGFTSPVIVQAIEAMDMNRVCSEYWDTRPYSRPQVQMPQKAQSEETRENFNRSDQEAAGINLLSSGVDTMLGGLFKKTNLGELNSS